MHKAVLPGGSSTQLGTAEVNWGSSNSGSEPGVSLNSDKLERGAMT